MVKEGMWERCLGKQRWSGAAYCSMGTWGVYYIVSPLLCLLVISHNKNENLSFPRVFRIMLSCQNMSVVGLPPVGKTNSLLPIN